MEDILLIGGGGHCKSVIDSIIEGKEYNIIGILDKSENIGKTVFQIEIIGADDDMQKFFDKGIKKAVITVGSIGNTSIREQLYNRAKSIGYKFPIIIDKYAIVSRFSNIQEGTFIGKNVVVNADAKIGKCCILNTGCIVEHECIIDDFVHLAPASVLCGNTHIDRSTHIGANSVVIQGKTIGSNTLIGAGSTIIKDIDNNIKAYGNPCVKK